MSAHPLSTGEAVQHVLEGRECESDGEFSWKMSLHGDTPCLFGRHTTQCVRSAHVALRWRLVPKLVKREEALKALAEGKAIRRAGRCYATGLDDQLRCFEQNVPSWPPHAAQFVEDFLDDSACWEILP